MRILKPQSRDPMRPPELAAPANAARHLVHLSLPKGDTVEQKDAPQAADSADATPPRQTTSALLIEALHAHSARRSGSSNRVCRSAATTLGS
jgi:hypothetical protein